MHRTFNSYSELYSALVTFTDASCPTILFFIVSVKNTEGCDCTGLKKGAQARFKSLACELLPHERTKLLQHLNAETIILAGDDWKETIL
jgi:hypothetical protein